MCVWPGASDGYIPVFPVTCVSSLPPHLLPSLPFSCPLVARQHSSGAREAGWQCPAEKALVFPPLVAASWLGVVQLAEGQRQPSVAVAFPPLGVNPTVRGNTWRQGMGWSRAVSFPFTPKRHMAPAFWQEWVKVELNKSVHFRNVNFISLHASLSTDCDWDLDLTLQTWRVPLLVEVEFLGLVIYFLVSCYSKYGLGTNSIRITWEFVRITNLSPILDLLNQNLHFVRMAR